MDKGSVTVYDDLGQPVQGATVTGDFSGDVNDTIAAVTDANGVAVLTTTSSSKSPISYTFIVTDVAHTTLTYTPAANVVTSIVY